MKAYWYWKLLTGQRKRRPNAQPLMLWTRETGTWREIKPRQPAS